MTPWGLQPGLFVLRRAGLLARGNQGLSQALRVGALLEETGLRDILEAMEATDNTDILTLYDDLLARSRNHLRAFVGRIEGMGRVYAAQVQPQERVDAIVDAPMERGRRLSGGRAPPPTPYR